MAQDVKRRFWRGIRLDEIVEIGGTDKRATVKSRYGGEWTLPDCGYNEAVQEVEDIYRMNDRCDEQTEFRLRMNSVDRAVRDIQNIESSKLRAAAVSLARSASKVEKVLKEIENGRK